MCSLIQSLVHTLYGHKLKVAEAQEAPKLNNEDAGMRLAWLGAGAQLL